MNPIVNGIGMLLTVTLSSCSTHYYLVRHAEKTRDGLMDPLTANGTRRAFILRDSLNRKSIDTLFSSNYLRTIQTAEPTAVYFHKTLTRIDDQNTPTFLHALRAFRNKRILIVGHTNTIPFLVEGLSGQSIDSIPSWDFDNFYHVEISRFLGTRKYLSISRYGNISIPP